MALLRRRLRVFATTWALLQLATLTALVPRECCAGHRLAAKSCHQVSSAAECPMHAGDGSVCPHQADRSSAPKCRLNGMCDGPGAALFALLANHGVLPASTAALHTVDVSSVAAVVDENPTSLFEAPEAPPPRA